MVKRPVFVDSALGQTGFTTAGQVKLKLANPLHNVSKVRLRDAQIPRLDDITYVAIGLRCGRGSFIDNVQIPYNPSSVSTSGMFNVTGIVPQPPLFGILPVAQATSVAAIDANANVPYVYLNQERYEFTFQPPINNMDELEIQLYRPPSATSPSVLAPYDTQVFVASLDTALDSSLVGSIITNKASTDQRNLDYFFNGTVLGTKGSQLLLGSVSSTSAASSFATFLQQTGLLAAERALYLPNGTTLATVATLVSLTTQTTLNLEFDCGR